MRLSAAVAVAEQARQEVGSAGAPVDPFNVTSLGADRCAAGVEVFDVEREHFAGARGGDDHQARRLVLAIAACALGQAVFLTEGVLADRPDPLGEAKREAAAAASALITTYAA